MAEANGQGEERDALADIVGEIRSHVQRLSKIQNLPADVLSRELVATFAPLLLDLGEATLSNRDWLMESVAEAHDRIGGGGDDDIIDETQFEPRHAALIEKLCLGTKAYVEAGLAVSAPAQAQTQLRDLDETADAVLALLKERTLEEDAPPDDDEPDAAVGSA